MLQTEFAFLFFSLPRHNYKFNSTPWQLANEIAVRHKVLFADNPLTITEALGNLFSKGIFKIIAAYFGKCWYSNNDVIVITMPIVLPINFLPPGKMYNFFSLLNQFIVAKRINRVITVFKIQRLVYVNSFNFYFPVLWRFLITKPSCIVYHCIDPMVKNYTLKHGIRLQEEAAKKSNLIISTTPSLKRSFQREGFPESIYIPNAANFSLFANSQCLNESLGTKIKSIKGKIMGYVGNIERRFDEDLILTVLGNLPEWNLVLAGPIENSYFQSDFLNHPRIVFMGTCTHAEAPAIINMFDVAIIPFKVDEVSNGIYPLKLFEYLAVGKKVVTTNFNPEVLKPLSDTICIADNAIHFSQLVSLREPGNLERINKRREIAWKNSWEVRSQQFLTAIKVNVPVR